MTRAHVPDRLPLGRDSITFRLTLEPVTVAVGGPRALILQVMHPVVGAGVADHSDYETNPWSRLIRTVMAMTQLSLGTPEQSQQVSRMLRKSHAAIKGTTADGESYRALDPDNMLWVWATLLDTLIAVSDRFIRPLAADELDQLYDEWLLIAEACGVPREVCPADYHAFRDYIDTVLADELVPTMTAKNVTHMLQRPPLPRPLADLAGLVLGIVVPGQLPRNTREALGLRWDPRQQRLFDIASSAGRAVAWLTPGPLRRLPMGIAKLGMLSVPPSRTRRRLAVDDAA